MGRSNVEVGFTVAWRYLPNADLAFWKKLGRAGGAPFRRALDFVGAQIYPGLVWPPVSIPGRSAGVEMTDALALLRRCYMPLAGLGPRSRPLGYRERVRHKPRALGCPPAARARVDTRCGPGGLGHARGHATTGTSTCGTTTRRASDLFAAVGLLRDDYSRKPAFGVLARAIREYGR